jgi:peptidoglycan/LPS O-acetylase OafA/YrhL
MILNIQMLRAFAALGVVLFHLGPQYAAAGGGAQWLVGLAEWGFFGIDIFFVISGFVISHAVFSRKRDSQGTVTYFRHRLSRIYLGYWPFALLALYALPLHSPENLAQVSTWRTMTLGSADPDLLALSLAWPLAYGLYFYALFGALYLCGNTLLQRILMLLFGLMLLRVLFMEVDTGSKLYFWVSPFMLEFFFGVMIYLYRDVLSKRRMIAPAVVMLFAGFTLVTGQVDDNDIRALCLGLCATGLVLLALQLESNKIFVAPQWLVNLGDSSYSLYLSHLFVIAAFYQWGWRDELAAKPQFMIELGFLGVLLYIVFLAHFWYRRLELPLYRKAIGKPLKSPLKPD